MQPEITALRLMAAAWPSTFPPTNEKDNLWYPGYISVRENNSKQRRMKILATKMRQQHLAYRI